MSDDTAAFTVTMKAGTGYDAPWVVVRADDANQLHERLNAVLPGFPVISEAATELAAIYTTAKGLGATEVPTAPTPPPVVNPVPARLQQAWTATPPTQAQQSWVAPVQTAAPAAQAPVAGGKTCIHGAMSFKSGAKNGKPWSGFFCPTPKGTQGQCDPVWVG